MPQVELHREAPDFRLKDLNGKQFKLSDYRGKNNILLVLNRGFVWPFCREHLAQLRRDFQLFVERDTLIVSIGPDDSAAYRRYWEKNELPFVGLPDEEHQVLKLYGQQVNLFKMGRQPAQMLIDKKGILRYVHYGHSMKDIPSTEEMTTLLDELQVEASS